MTTPEVGKAKAAAMAKALDTMWARFLPEINERVQVLDQAAEAAVAGRRSHKLRAAAHQAAHKLAGTLGTFSLGHGTDLAREAEILYTRDELVPEEAVRLKKIALDLRAIVDNRRS